MEDKFRGALERELRSQLQSKANEIECDLVYTYQSRVRKLLNQSVAELMNAVEFQSSRNGLDGNIQFTIIYKPTIEKK